MSASGALSFAPSTEVAAVLHVLLDIYERRELARRDEYAKRQAIRVKLDDAFAPSYFSQTDPAPRGTANTQFQQLERAGVVKLDWLRGEQGHLLAAVTLDVAQAQQAYEVLGRASLASKRKTLMELLLSERAQFQTSQVLKTSEDSSDWRIRALTGVLHHLREGKSAAPFNLNDMGLNEDVMAALRATGGVREETPHRVFSVRVFNDSKRFEQVASRLVTLAKRGNPAWRTFTREEVLSELNLVANPNHLFLFGDWDLADAADQIISLAAFAPSVGLPSAQAARLKSASVKASRVICVENLTSFYELARLSQTSEDSKSEAQVSEVFSSFAAICLMGNPSPACRHLLRRLPQDTSMFVWADMDYGGFNILAQIRSQVNPNAQPVYMDVATFDRHAKLARPLTPGDVRRLTRLMQYALLDDVKPAIAHLLSHGLKLEQEAINLALPLAR
jgi:hypothetical protein